MKDRKFQNEDLDDIGRSLLKAGMARADEVERIVSRPELFALIRSRIESENAEARPAGFLHAWRMQLVLSGGLAAVVVTAAVLAFAVLRQTENQSELAYVVEPPPQEVIHESLLQPVPAIVPAPAAPAEARPQRSYGPPTSVTAKVYRRRETRRAGEAKKPEKAVDLGEFYALAHVPNAPDAALDAQVIRVEVPRASLVALGINVPLDSGRENVKTDLLVGADGVPRAIRLVE